MRASALLPILCCLLLAGSEIIPIDPYAGWSGTFILDTGAKCHPGNFYPGGKVDPAFYQSTDSPQWTQYLDCVWKEACEHGFIRLATAEDFPRIGTCYPTRVEWIGSRFDTPPSDIDGTGMNFENGIQVVEYVLLIGAVHSRVGDPVKVCMRSFRTDCPAHDLRGIVYRIYNLRTGESWDMPNSQHGCGGP